jgi:hypothetical protein
LTTIYNKAAKAQNISSGADRFYGVNRANITLYVPAGSKQTYLNAGWTGFKEIREDGNTAVTPETNAELPTLASQPTDSTVKLGEAARLSVSANVSKGKLSYQWYETSSQSNGTTNLIAGATSASYQPNTSAAGTKYYFAIVTNTDTSATGQKIAQVKTRIAAVTVKENAVTNAQAPTITSQPNDLTIKQNENAQLTVTASVSKGQLSYQWYESANNNNANGTAIKGAVNASYQPNTSAAGTKYYYVIVTNTDASATGSKSAQTVSRAVMIITNSNNSNNTEDTWLPNRPYTGGQTVIYNGLKYRAKWWTTARPDTGDTWELLSANGSTEYIPGKVYVQGDEAAYKGQTWRAKWWTRSAPGSDNSWELK